jgi:hypothetical protein
MKKELIVFVGQSPSMNSDPVSPLSNTSGLKLSEMLEISMSEFLEFARHNLNHYYSGKEGKGDAFDFDIGEESAKKLISMPYRRYVLLGASVTSCFSISWSPLELWERGDKSFLCFPHPSGINMWYNKPENRKRAKAKLKEFVYGK